MNTHEDIALSRRHASETRTRVFRGKRGERGSVLIFVMLAAAVLTASVATVSNTSTTATSSLSADEAEASSMAAAEFGANLAKSDIAAWSAQDENAGLDYVYGKAGEKLYVDPESGAALDNRRFQGTFGDREFRVMVRSVDLAKKNSTKPAEWLWNPGTDEFLYEITSAARSKDVDLASLPAERRMEAIVNQVVSVTSRDGWNGAGDLGPLFVTEPANFQVAMGENIVLSGEDHEINKYYVEKFDSRPQITTPLKLTATEANFMLADGGYWRAGQLTLNYRMYPDGPLANPHRPRTTAFGNGNNQAMMAAFPNVVNERENPDDPESKFKEYDTYLLGGKVHGGGGRTVTLNNDLWANGVKGTIIETNGNDTSQGGAFNLVLGKFEDLRNLYINMAGVVGRIENPNDWWQVYVGQYSHSRRSMTGFPTKPKCLPNYGGHRVRAQTVHLMKNVDGEVLVRLFEKDVTVGYGSNRETKKYYYKYPISGSKWTGYYTWADVDYAKAGVTLKRNVNPSETVPGEASGQNVVVRTFFWQELVGYQLLTRGEHWQPRYNNSRDSDNDPNEPAIIEQADAPSDGSQRIDKRTMYKYNPDGSRIPAGFDEVYQAYDTTVLGTYTNRIHPQADKYGNPQSVNYLRNRADSIFVWEKNASGTWGLSEKAGMNDFLFQKNFGEKDENGDPILRDALALLIGYEDQRESGADFDYADMVFTIYIAPQVDQVVRPYTMFPLLTDQWWEQNPDNGLTGNPAHPGLTSNQNPETASMDDVHKANYDLLAYTPKADPENPDLDTFEKQVYTMRVGDGDMVNGMYMLRAKFGANGSNFVFIPTKDEDGNEIADFPYYYTADDVNAYIIHQWNLKKEEYGDPTYWPTAKLEFLDLIPDRFTVQEIDRRWEPDTVAQPILTGDSADSSYKPLDTMLSLRKVAAEIIGYKYQSVPVVETYELEPIKGEDNQPVAAQPEDLGFLAGEMIQKADSGSGEWVVTDLAGSVEYRNHETEQKDGTITPIREFLFDASESPRFDPGDPYSADRNSAVNMCYVNYYESDPAKQVLVEDKYGYKDKRYSIGFHRSGDDEHYAEGHAQDHYENVFLGQKGFNPYMTTTDGRFIAKNSLVDPDDVDPGTRLDFQYAFKYGNDGPIPEEGKVPDFVFNKPIDGAGIMVVNGNLIVSDVFAYHGLLLVLGDVIVRPLHRPDRLVFGDDGNPLDAYDHSLYLNENREWAYTWQNPYNEDDFFSTTVQCDDETGLPLKDANGAPIPVKPIYAEGADAVRGRLVVQGNLLVGGKVLTESTQVPGTDEYVTGEINAYASDAAGELTKWLSGINKDIVEVVSWTSGNREAFQDDIDRLWSGSVE